MTISYFDFVPAALQPGIAAGTDTTTDQSPFWTAFRDALAAMATSGNRPHGVIPQCTIRTSTAPNFAMQNLHLETQGLPKIISTSAAPGFLCNGTGMGSGGWGVFGLKIGSLMAGTTSGLRGIEIRYCHQSDFDPLFCLGATSQGIYLSFLVSSILRSPTCSPSPIGGSFLATPRYGIWLGAESGDSKGNASGWTTLINPIGEYVSEGIVVDRSHGALLIGGTAESCSTVGLTITENAVSTNVVGSDFEANGQYDIHCKGHYGGFTDIKSEKNFAFWGAASQNTVRGGVFNTITVDVNAARNRFDNIFYASQAGGNLNDSGIDTQVNNAWNHQAEKWYSSWKPATMTASVINGSGFTVSAAGRTRQENRTVHFTAEVTVSAVGTVTPTGYLALTLPYPSSSISNSFAGIEIGHNGKSVSAYLAPNSNVIQLRYADGSFAGNASGNFIVISGSYERA